MRERTYFNEYFEVIEMPVGEIPFSVINRALKHEKYFRRFTPTFCRKDLLQGHLAALLYWYPYYVEQLYELASEGKDFKLFFGGLPSVIIESFDYLFPELIKRLELAKEVAVNLTALEEIKIKRRSKKTGVTNENVNDSATASVMR